MIGDNDRRRIARLDYFKLTRKFQKYSTILGSSRRRSRPSSMANAAPPNPMGYPPKPPVFTRNQALAGLSYDLYRKTGSSIINFRNLQHVAKFVTWSQPYRWRAPLFRMAPRPGSALAAAQLERAIANRGTVRPATRRTRRSVTDGIGYATAERPRNAQRFYVWEAYNNEDTRVKFEGLDITFVKQLGWVCGTHSLLPSMYARTCREPIAVDEPDCPSMIGA